MGRVKRGANGAAHGLTKEIIWSWEVGDCERWVILNMEHANGAAHGPTKEAIWNDGDNIWMKEYPLCISQIMVSECKALFM